ncbi:response regulator [Clostridium sp. MCC353]|uniref:response regulator transcription factor n=1 Tax=Clostridium sp. MCC353 TaxID=2592646 RepID=UPI001C00B6DE|nr:response regulator transcription factor [Clostridium sp. MCC353]MBT9778787.1 response regulator [Clostridium sp. MCC353]
MRILLVEDDKELCDTVKLQLIHANYETDACYTGQDAFYYAAGHPYDVIILDRMLPGIDGISLLKSLRRQQISTPVIITTALDGINDRIDGLDAGADDYLVKPYAVEELLARIRALTRRPARLEPALCKSFSNISLDADRHELTGPGGTVTLSKREAALLEYLIRNANQILPRGLILSYIWGPDSEVEEGNLDNYIYFLRRRLKSVQALVQIKTIHGVGYRLEEGGAA